MKKARVLMITVAAALMVMGVGYAAWSQTLTMNVGGTLGSFAVKISDAYVIGEDGQAVKDDELASADVRGGGKEAVLTANKMIPGDCREFKVVFQNVGDCPAVLSKIDFKRDSGHEALDYISVSVDGGDWVGMKDPHGLKLSKDMKKGEYVSVTVKVMLDRDADNEANEKPFKLVMSPTFTQQ